MMYADDTVIYYSSPQLSEIELKLNLDLLTLNQWLLSNKLILNEKKTELMIFGTRQRLMRQNSDEFRFTVPQNTSHIYFLYKIWKKRAKYFIFVNIY